MKFFTLRAIKENKTLGPIFRYVKESEFSGFQSPNHDYETLATSLASGDFQSLNFRDPELVLKLYATPLESKRAITENMLVTGLMLAWAAESFYDEDKRQYPDLKKYQFDQKAGPYQIDKISYMSARQSEIFKRLNKKCENNGYYAINLPRKWLVTFLYDGLETLFVHNHIPEVKEKFISIFKKYYNIKYSTQDDAKLTPQQLDQFIKNPIPVVMQDIRKQIISWEPDLAEFLTMSIFSNESEYIPFRTQRDSIRFLVNLLSLNEQIPGVEISPDFDDHDPGSPLLCMINLTVDSTIQLQKAMHGDDCTLPLFLVGSPSLAVFAQSVCDPQQFNKTDCRPAEMYFPGLKRAPEYHGLQANHYLALWHDFLLHGFRNGANPYKSLIRYMIIFLQNLKKMPMSSWIWSLCDMDVSVGRIYREGLLNLQQKTLPYQAYKTEINRINMLGLSKIWGLLRNRNDFLSKNVFEYANEMDTMLAFIVDMHKNPENWQPLLRGHPSKDIFNKDNKLLFILCESSNVKSFLEIFNNMQAIVQAYPNKSIEFCILAYRLQEYPKCWSLLSELIDKFDLTKIFQWDRNGGVSFFELQNPQNPLDIIERLLLSITAPGLRTDEDILTVKKLRQEILQSRKSWPVLEIDTKSMPEEPDLILSPPAIVQSRKMTFFADEIKVNSSQSKAPRLLRSQSHPNLTGFRRSN